MLTIKLFAGALLVSQVLLAQSTLALSSASASGGSASLTLTLTTAAGTQPAALQWSVKYSAGYVLSINATAGPAAVAAGKSIYCASGTLEYKCILAGLNANTIQNGVVAVVNVTVSGTANIAIADTIAASPDGQALPVTGTGGTVTASGGSPTTVTGLSCAPSSLSSGASSACTVTVAGSGGGVVTLSSNTGSVTVPGSMSVPAGVATATFTAAAGVIATDQSATITASLNGSSRSASIALAAPPAITALNCVPATLSGGTSTACVVTLTNAAGGTVALASNNPLLMAPASVTVPSGTQTASFSASAGVIGSDQSATVTASLNGSSRSSSIALTTATTVSAISCAAATLAGGASTTCTVTLSKTGGGTVALSSSSPSVTVPASVAVSSSATTATFTATAAAIGAEQSATITGALNGSSRSTSLALNGPITVTALNCAPVSSASSTCTVTLSKTGGGTVALATNSTALTVPASVSVPAGSTTATFAATVGAFTNDQTATVTASLNGSSQSASVALTAPAAITSLTCAPVGAATSTTCVVIVTKPAGGTVALSSSTPSVTVPPSVSIPAGATSASFTATVAVVATDQTATITGVLNGSVRSASLAVNAAVTLTSLTCAPATMSSGTSSTCTVTLSASRGGTVALSSSSPALTVLGSVSVPSGGTTATFTATVGALTADQPATITASFNGSSRTAAITLTTAMTITSLTCSPSFLHSGASATCAVRLSRTSGATVALSTGGASLIAPSSVQVASGLATASFALTAGNITADEKATVTASLNGSSLSTPIELTTPTRLTSLSCTPTTLAQDGSAVCSVTLSTPAGAVVTLASDNGALIAPASVAVPAGATVQSFTVKAGAVAVDQTATIKATLGNSWMSALVTLTTAPGVRSLTCAPSTVVAGASSTCTVTLPHTQGATVTLASSSPALVVPAFVVVFPGFSTANFAVTASHAGAGQAVVTASLNGVSATATLTVSGANSISALSCSPDETTAGTLTCAVQLSQEAPPGGAPVKLQTTGSRLTPPAEVVVPEGQTSVAFAIRVAPSDVDEQPVITAAIGGAVRTTSLAIIGIRPTTLRFAANTAGAGKWIDGEIQLNRTNVPEVARLSLTSSTPDLRLPPSITTRPGQTRLPFKAYLEALAKQQNAEVAVQFGQTILKTTLTLEPGRAPILSLPREIATRFDEPVSFIVSAADPDGLPVVYAAESLPPGASFDPGSGAFSWTPGETHQGKYDVVFTATNTAEAVATGHVVIVVEGGKPTALVLRNAATRTGPVCSPGALASIEGRWLGSDRAGISDPSGSATTLKGTRVKVNDEHVPVVFASWNKVTFVCPAVEPGTALAVLAETEAGASDGVAGSSAAISPGLFTAEEVGAGQGLVYLSGTSLLAVSRDYRSLGQPAQPGDSVTIWATGFGDTSSPIVTLGDLVAQVSSVQRVPGMAGVVEITVIVPPGVPEGDHVPVVASFPLSETEGGDVVRSNAVTIAIEPGRQ
jgi:trimeric autotransporter adhesin